MRYLSIFIVILMTACNEGHDSRFDQEDSQDSSSSEMIAGKATGYIPGELDGNIEEGSRDHFKYARSAFSKGEYQTAANHFYAIYQSHPEHPEAGYGLGLSLMGMQKFDKAISYLQPVANEHTNYEDVNYQLALCYKQLKSVDLALTSINTGIKQKPENLEYRRLKATILQLRGEIKESQKTINFCIEQNSRVGSFYSIRAINFLLQNDSAQACLDFKRGLALGESYKAGMVEAVCR